MQTILDRYLFSIPRNVADAGGGNGEAAGAGDAAGADPLAGGGDAAGSGSQAANATPPAEPYFPEGLPDHFKGESERDTIDRLAGAWKDYRSRDANKDLPEKPEGYLSLEGIDEKSFQLDERFKPHFEGFAADPGMQAAAAIAQKHGVSRPVFLEAMQASMSALLEAGLLEPMVDFAAERAALLPEAAQSLPKDQQDVAIDKRMNDNFAFVDLMVANRALPKEVGEYAQLMLGDKAEGHQFLEWMRNAVQGGNGGGGPGAHGQGGGGSITHAYLKERQADPRNNPSDMKFEPAFEQETRRLYRAFVEGGGKFEE